MRPVYLHGTDLELQMEGSDAKVILPEYHGVLEFEEFLQYGDKGYIRKLPNIDIRLNAERFIVDERNEEMSINKNKKWVHVVVHAYGEKRILLETDIYTDLDEDTFMRLYRLIRAELKIIKDYEEPLYLAKAVIQAMQDRRYVHSNALDETWHIENAGCKS